MSEEDKTEDNKESKSKKEAEEDRKKDISVLSHGKVLTKEEQQEKKEKLEALTRSNIIRKKIKRLDFISNALFLVSFALILFVIIRYVFYVCYELNQCSTVNWLLIVGVLAIIIVFLIIVRFEKRRVKRAILKLKERTSKKVAPQQVEKSTRTKLEEFLKHVTNLKAKIDTGNIKFKDAYHDLYLIFKSFISEYLQIPKAMTTSELAEAIRNQDKLNPKLSNYSSELLLELFKANYSDMENREQLRLLAEATQRLMSTLLRVR